MGKSYEILIKNVKRLLIERSWSQEQLGEKAGVSQERISNLLNGKTEPTLFLVDKISDAFGIEVTTLLSNDNQAGIINQSQPSYDPKHQPVVFSKYGKISKVKNVTIHIPHLQEFRSAYISFAHDDKWSKSGKATSYANYIEYLFQNYFDNYSEVLDPLDNATPQKIDDFRKKEGFKAYNSAEKGFPNAAIETYLKFMVNSNRESSLF